MSFWLQSLAQASGCSDPWQLAGSGVHVARIQWRRLAMNRIGVVLPWYPHSRVGVPTCCLLGALRPGVARKPPHAMVRLAGLPVGAAAPGQKRQQQLGVAWAGHW